MLRWSAVAMTGEAFRRLRRLCAGWALAGGLAGLLALGARDAAAAAGLEAPCPAGAYRLEDGGIVDVARSGDGFRWRSFTGLTGKLSPDGEHAWTSTYGWTERDDGLRVSFGPCASGAMSFGGKAARRLDLKAEDIAFQSHGVRLQGRLVLPPGSGPVPIVVLLQGAEHDSARAFDPLQRLLPAAGVGAFVYDKRGTGDSGGVYTQDFSLLADDAVAALSAARKLAGGRAGRIGFQGPSQGGWVAPIAAGRAHVDFIIVSFGLAVSVLDEDQEAIALQMRMKGYGPETIARAQEIGLAAGLLFESGFTRGFERFEALRAKYRNEPWFKDVYGNFTHVFLEMTPQEVRAAGPRFRWGTPLRYDPMPTLRALRTPQLWVLGGQDVDAPSQETIRRLKHLMGRGRPITLAVYPKAEHGMTEFELAKDGTRVSTRYAEGYFRLMRDFARGGRLDPPYGDARITPRAR